MVYSAARHSTRRACPDCGADLDAATPVYVGDAEAPDLRRHARVATDAEVKPLPSDVRVGVSLESQNELRGSVTHDPADAVHLGWRWIDAANRCDVEALIGMADPDITIVPTRLVAP